MHGALRGAMASRPDYSGEDNEIAANYAPAPTGAEEDGFLDDEPVPLSILTPPPASPARPNFLLASLLFSINHGCVTACLNLATARLGNVGAVQSATLYVSYAASALLGSTAIVKSAGAKNSLAVGMGIYCVYVGCFALASLLMDRPMVAEAVALGGATVGGLAGGILWTAQGSFFARSAEMHSLFAGVTLPDATSDFGANFAAIYLLGEVALNMLSSVLVEAFELSWVAVFIIYFAIAVVSVVLMLLVHEYPSTENDGDSSDIDSRSDTNTTTPNKATATWRLLTEDPKMICMLPFNFVFGFAASFRASFVSREVVRIALKDENSKYIGFLSSVTAIVAATMSLVFGKVAHVFGKGTILAIGVLSFFLVAFPFILFPELENWGLISVLLIYIFQGVGRSTFEGTLKAVFADFFPYEKEGAYANIVLQNGISNALGFYLSVNLPCSSPGKYCIKYTDGKLHNVLVFEIIVMITAVLAVIGYWRASSLFAKEATESSRERRNEEEKVAFVSTDVQIDEQSVT
uniref:Major facilitator superfamily (MFS) profile domain-containing protein n=1 Tax=Trieres chinensis TaxID=1514140 RepID=A0A7S1ZZF6_TRICV|mmetsp:Transcript_36385/g.74278  ORF Transcript_36385/g.74278 Transcript_36385/m.74278 type:complete len:521 (+) Transcript_36385:33-1595(+)